MRIPLLLIFLLFTGLGVCIAQDKVLDSLTEAMRDGKDDSNKVHATRQLAKQFLYTDPDTSNLLYSQALELARNINFDNGIGSCLMGLGNSYFTRGRYPEALEAYLRALKHFEDNGPRKGIARAYNGLGVVYRNQGEYAKALEYYKNAIEIDTEFENSKGIARHLGNIGTVYWSMRDLDSSLTYLLQALDLSKELGLHRDVARHMGNIAAIYSDQGIFDKAEEFFRRGLKMSQEQNEPEEIAKNLGNLGALYVKQERFGEASDYLTQSLKVCEEIGMLQGIKYNEFALSELYESWGKHREALEHYKAFTTLKDSIFNEDKSKEIGKLEAKHEFESAEAERKRLEEEKRREEEAAETRRNNLQYSGILIFLVLVFAAVFALGRITIPVRLAEGLIFFSFLLFFEFMLVLLDPYIESFSGGEPAYKLMVNALIAALIFPLHSFFESRIKYQLS